MICTIENEYLRLKVNSQGGAMCSLVYRPTGEERLHQPDGWWQGQDVVIFPVIGHAGGFVARGKECLLKSHGLIRYAELSLKSKSENSLTLSLASTPSSLEKFPYEWEFEITYTLSGNTLLVDYFVRSVSGEMPFYVGGHPGMYAPDGKAKIIFENEENPLLYPLDGSGATPVGKLRSFSVDKEFFGEHKTYQLGALSGGAVSAKTADGYLYTYRSDCPLYAFWSNEKGGDYVCVEPWWGINDYEGAPREITLKPFMNFDRGEGKHFSYTLTVEKV